MIIIHLSENVLKLISCVPTSPRASVTTSNDKLGPTSGVGQCLVRHVNQCANEWSDVDHQDVLRDRTLVTQTVELGHRRWAPNHTPVISEGEA